MVWRKMIKDYYNEGYTVGFKDGCNFSKIIKETINEELIAKLIKDCDLIVQSESAIKFADLVISAEQNRLVEIIDNEIKTNGNWQTWKSLTDTEYQNILTSHNDGGLILFYHLIEEKLKEKNNFKFKEENNT